MLKTYQNLHFHHLKKVYKMLKLGIFPVFDKIFTANILGIWEKRTLFTPRYELVSQYSWKNLILKLMIMIQHTKIMQIPCLYNASLWKSVS